MKKILKNIKIFWWLLPIFILIILTSRWLLTKYTGIVENDITILISVFGVFFTYFGFYAAYSAQKKSDEIQKDLLEFGLINNPKESFEVIFNEDLIPSLHEAAKREIESNVYLLLSSPAYGYPVVSKDTYNQFKTALFDLDSSKKVEMMFFCSDSHFDYWCNILLWDLSNKEEVISVSFAEEVYDVLDKIRTRDNFKIFIKKEVSIRLYGFDYGNRGNLSSEISRHKADKVYLCMVDPFNIVMSQLEISRARHIQLPSRNISDYIGGNDNESLFERMKQCPYRMKKFNEAEVTHDLLPHLIVDYIFGLTSISKVVGEDCFILEFNLFFENYKKNSKIMSSQKTDELLLKEIVENILKYYCSVITFIKDKPVLDSFDQNVGFIFSIIKNVAAKINFDLNSYTEIKDKINTAQDYQINNQTLISLLPTDLSIDFYKKAIYYLLYSGMGKSTYYKKLTNSQH